MNHSLREKTKFRQRGAIKCKVGFANVGSATLASNLKPNGINFVMGKECRGKLAHFDRLSSDLCAMDSFLWLRQFSLTKLM